MSHNERHEELAALLALGASLGADGAELERHLAEGCERCGEILAEGRARYESTACPEPDAQNFAVTVEPRGGMPAPTGPVVLVGSPT